MINLFQGESAQFLMQIKDNGGHPLNCNEYEYDVLLKLTYKGVIYKWPKNEVILSENNYLFFELKPKISEALAPGRYILEVNVKKGKDSLVGRLCKSINIHPCVVSHV